MTRSTMDGTTPTLFSWAGGDEALSRLTETFYAEVLRDDLLGPVFRRGMDEHHPAYVAAWLALLTDAADTVGLPDDPEFRSAFVAYLEWGTRLAVATSAPGATPPPAAPVPRWGWGEAPPYTA